MLKRGLPDDGSVLRDVARHVRTVVHEGLMRASARPRGVVLVMHGLSDEGTRPAGPIVPEIARSRFEKHLSYLERHHRVVALDDLDRAVRRRRRGERLPVAITFDDDLRSHVTIAAPVLAARGRSATFFLCGASLDRPHAFWWEHLQAGIDAGLDVSSMSPTLSRVAGAGGAHDVATSARSLAGLVEAMPPAERDAVSAELARAAGPDPDQTGLRAADVRRLVSLGMRIGFHTRDHEPLDQLGDAELARAMVEGRSALERVVGYRLREIAYPHGRLDERTAGAARAAGFQLGLTTRPTAVTPAGDPFAVGRLEPSSESTLRFAAQFVAAARRAASAG